MNISFNDPTTLQQDNSWQLQGRIIPPSCTAGDGCILHLQTRHMSWSKEHFHVGRSPVTPEVGLEFAMSLLMPMDDDLVRLSYDPEETDGDIDYLRMVRLGNPEDAIAFLTVTGLTIIIQIEGLGAMFGPSEKCSHCSKSSNIINLPQQLELADSNGRFDQLMEMKDSKSH